MIVDKIENIDMYTGLSRGVIKALKLLKDGKLAQKADGRYEVDGDDLFYVISSYTTKPGEECRFETHEKYIDVQALLAGEESMGYICSDDLSPQTPYDGTRDIAFYETPDHYSRIAFSAGMFCIFYAHDGHMPGGQLDAPSDVRKVIFKVRIV
jgi:biofilm protein TabA